MIARDGELAPPALTSCNRCDRVRAVERVALSKKDVIAPGKVVMVNLGFEDLCASCRDHLRGRGFKITSWEAST